MISIYKKDDISVKNNCLISVFSIIYNNYYLHCTLYCLYNICLALMTMQFRGVSANMKALSTHVIVSNVNSIKEKSKLTFVDILPSTLCRPWNL
jgi:hypothetical protein